VHASALSRDTPDARWASRAYFLIFTSMGCTGSLAYSEL